MTNFVRVQADVVRDLQHALKQVVSDNAELREQLKAVTKRLDVSHLYQSLVGSPAAPGTHESALAAKVRAGLLHRSIILYAVTIRQGSMVTRRALCARSSESR